MRKPKDTSSFINQYTFWKAMSGKEYKHQLAIRMRNLYVKDFHDFGNQRNELYEVIDDKLLFDLCIKYAAKHLNTQEEI